jgi:hypothetical protein
LELATQTSLTADTYALTLVDERSMVIDFFVNPDGRVCAFHDRPFPYTIEWVEFTYATGRVEFIREDGSICNFGIAVNATLKPHFANATHIHLIQLDKSTGTVGDVRVVALNLQTA